MPIFSSFFAQGQEPFHLPSVQSATASGGSNEVEMVLSVLENSGRDQHGISVQMTADGRANLVLACLRLRMMQIERRGVCEAHRGNSPLFACRCWCGLRGKREVGR